jgi:MoxR-like ATPase
MSQLTENLTVTSQQAKPAIKAVMKANRPSFLWGPPGVGKSELVEEITNLLISEVFLSSTKI